uniref:Uncharacterized protein n=1 Tax=Amphilophus citrinellus TaxID=61819 RepID=A0A3Q0QZW4_AMPCI
DFVGKTGKSLGFIFWVFLSETRRDGGYKHNWSFSLPGDSEEERRHDSDTQMCLCCCHEIIVSWFRLD